MRAIVLSIRREWAERIFAREKQFELRKNEPKDPLFLLQDERPVYFYVPEAKGLTGRAVFAGTECRQERALNQLLRLPLCLGLNEIRQYGPGRDGLYHAWELWRAERWPEALPLSVFGLKRPPRSWQYVDL